MILATERMILREFERRDAKALYQMNLAPEVLKFTGDLPFKNIAKAEQFIEEYTHYAIHGYGRWTCELKSTGEAIGWCGLKMNEENLIDLGFRFVPSAWGNGYATEAALACLEYGKHTLDLEEIIGRVAPENQASIRVLEKCGMKEYKKGQCGHHDSALYFR
ncbi:MAG: GNAT family N-acetyltransferase [Flavobacteriales bacterium]